MKQITVLDKTKLKEEQVTLCTPRGFILSSLIFSCFSMTWNIADSLRNVNAIIKLSNTINIYAFH